MGRMGVKFLVFLAFRLPAQFFELDAQDLNSGANNPERVFGFDFNRSFRWLKFGPVFFVVE